MGSDRGSPSHPREEREAHIECMNHPRTQLQRAGCPDTEDNDRGCRWRIENDRNQEDMDGTASLKICEPSEIRNCSFR